MERRHETDPQRVTPIRPGMKFLCKELFNRKDDDPVYTFKRFSDNGGKLMVVCQVDKLSEFEAYISAFSGMRSVDGDFAAFEIVRPQRQTREGLKPAESGWVYINQTDITGTERYVLYKDNRYCRPTESSVVMTNASTSV